MENNIAKNILWIGSVFSEEDSIKEKAISLAANRWQLGMLNSLIENDYSIFLIGHLPCPVFPKGRMIVTRKTYLGKKIEGYYFSYLNILGIRNLHLSFQYYSLVKKTLKRHHDIAFIVFYNLNWYHTLALKIIKKRYKVSIYGIVADVNKNELKGHYKLEKYYDYLLYLSYAFYKESNHPGKIFLEGGIDNFKSPGLIECDKAKKIIMYAGGLGGHGGVNLLLDAYSQLNRNDVELWICGKGQNNKLLSMLQKDSSIKNLGVLSELELIERSRKVYLFVNPRPSDYENNYYNFPSKILDYLAYNKLIVSTKSPGLSPDYSRILEITVDETPRSLCKSLNKLLDYTKEEYEKRIEFQNEFSKEKLWKSQIQKVIGNI
jgi:hypothetical protein